MARVNFIYVAHLHVQVEMITPVLERQFVRERMSFWVLPCRAMATPCLIHHSYSIDDFCFLIQWNQQKSVFSKSEIAHSLGLIPLRIPCASPLTPCLKSHQYHSPDHPVSCFLFNVIHPVSWSLINLVSRLIVIFSLSHVSYSMTFTLSLGHSLTLSQNS